MALEMTRKAITLEDSPELRRREERLKSRIGSPRSAAATAVIRAIRAIRAIVKKR